MKKTNVAVLLGGKSAEHEVSLSSAINIVKALDPDRYQIYLIAIDKKGHWHLLDSVATLEKAAQARKLPFERSASSITLLSTDKGMQIFDLPRGVGVGMVDVVFPALHGPFGEDGSVQGYLKTLNVAYVGSGILGSAVSMDKDVMKRLLRDAGLPIADFVVIRTDTRAQTNFDAVTKRLGLPVFVKAANLGSSIGVYKVKTREEWEAALTHAFHFDHKVVVEAFVQGREVECAVLGNATPRASQPGEVKPSHEFYSYEAKYLDEHGAELLIPAPLPGHLAERIKELAIRAYQVLCCEGLGRVDFFVKSNGEILINEINTLPGFTKISMYPKMWEASGIGYAELVNELIALAQSRFQSDCELRTSREA